MGTERLYECTVKCQFANRLWYPVRTGIKAQQMTTDRDDVPLTYFKLIGEVESEAPVEAPVKKTPVKTAPVTRVAAQHTKVRKEMKAAMPRSIPNIKLPKE